MSRSRKGLGKGRLSRPRKSRRNSWQKLPGRRKSEGSSSCRFRGRNRRWRGLGGSTTPKFRIEKKEESRIFKFSKKLTVCSEIGFIDLMIITPLRKR